MAFLLDTSIMVGLIEAEAKVASALRALPSHPRLSAISQVELEAGVYRDPSSQAIRRRALDEVLARMEVITFDSACARAYGDIVGAAGFSRRKVVDRMIAAQALVHGLTLVTANPGDFTDIPGLQVLAV